MASRAAVDVSFISHQPSFSNVIGQEPQVYILAEDTAGQPLFHEACVYHGPSKSVFVTSGQYRVTPSSEIAIKLFRIHDRVAEPALVEDITPSELSSSMLNGGTNYDDSSILLCAQGSKNEADLSGIVHVRVPTSAPTQSDAATPNEASAAAEESQVQTVVSSYHSRPFSSLNDVIVHPVDKSIWFTDPCYGYHQGFRPAPRLPNQVYRYDPATQTVRAVADGFVRCNGLCLSPDLHTMYITDTGAAHGHPDVAMDPAGQNHIYAFDVIERHGGSFLANRRLFAYADGGCPDGIKCDRAGNVFSGCGDGVEVWNPAGVLLGRIVIPGGVANLCFGGDNGRSLYMCNETRFLKLQLAELI